MSIVDWHREMLADRRRVRALDRAIRGAVSPGDTVLDLGTGSGVLACLACRAGASRVYALERSYMVGLARQIAEVNGLGEKIVFIQGESREVELAEPVDLVVAEIIGSFGLEEGILGALADARRRFLKPGGRLLPDTLELHLAPTEQGDHYRLWPRELEAECGLDFSPLAELCEHVWRGLRADPSRFLGKPAELMRFDLYADEPTQIRGQVDVEIERPGALAGWVGWFNARFDGRDVVSTIPPIPESSWRNAFFPVGEPVEVRPGEVAGLRMRLVDPFWSWEFVLPSLTRRFDDFQSYPAGAFRPREQRSR